MFFKKNYSANLVSKSRKYWKNRPQKIKETQNAVLNLKGMIPLLFYCVKHIHRQCKTYLKLQNINFKQIEKTISTVGKKLAMIFFWNHFVLYPIDISNCTILFLLICHVFIVLYGVLMLYVMFTTWAAVLYRAEGESLYIRYNTDANVVNNLKNDSSYEFIGKVILKINVV
jgi:hypothetical protein